jgi:hypothetical protein
MSKFSTLSKKTRKAIVYGVLITVLLLAILTVYMVSKLEEQSRTFIFNAQPSTTTNVEMTYRYGVLDQEDYDDLTIDYSGLENLTFDEIDNSSPLQENSKISKEYGNLQLDFIYPRGSIYKIDGSSVSINSQYLGVDKKYYLNLVNTDSFTQVFNTYSELLTYLQPYIYMEDQNFSTLSIITDADRSNDSSIRLLSNGFGFTQYGFPSECEFTYSHKLVPVDTTNQNTQSFNIQEICPPNQAAYFPGLLDTVGYMDKIDYFITTDDASGSFPIIIDPNDAYAIITGNTIIESDEVNSYLFIIDSSSRVHLTAHNNFVRLSTNWSTLGKIPKGRSSFPRATLEMKNLTGELQYGKNLQLIETDSVLEIINGVEIRTYFNYIGADIGKITISSSYYVRGLFEEIVLNGRRLITIKE